MRNRFPRAGLIALALMLVMVAGCRTASPRTFAARKGDEIIVAGRLFHTGTHVITWMDPGGYDAYRVERRFSPSTDACFTTDYSSMAAAM